MRALKPPDFWYHCSKSHFVATWEMLASSSVKILEAINCENVFDYPHCPCIQVIWHQKTLSGDNDTTRLVSFIQCTQECCHVIWNFKVLDDMNNVNVFFHTYRSLDHINLSSDRSIARSLDKGSQLIVFCYHWWHTVWSTAAGRGVSRRPKQSFLVLEHGEGKRDLDWQNSYLIVQIMLTAQQSFCFN